MEGRGTRRTKGEIIREVEGNKGRESGLEVKEND